MPIIDSKRILHTMCASPLMGMGRKEWYRLSKISGYATGVHVGIMIA